VRILHLYKDYYPPVRGGVETVAARMAHEAARAGAEVTVLTSAHGVRRDSEDWVDGVRVLRCAEWGRVASTPICPGMPLRLAPLRADILHLHYPSPPGEISCLLTGRKRGIVITYHGDVVRQTTLMRFYRPLAEAILDRAEVLMPTSPAYLEFSPYLRARRERCEVVPLGIDLEPFVFLDRDGPDALRIRSRYGGAFMLFVGRFRYYKGLPVLMRALARAPMTLVVIGDGPEAPAIRALVSELRIEKHVHFVGDVDDAELRSHLAAAEAFVLPSVAPSEAFGLALVEAQAAGLPSISTELGTGTSFVNVDGETGIVVPPRDPNALAVALTRLHGDPDLRARLGRAARARAVSLFSTQAMMRALTRVYERVAGPLGPS
jgi:rhamnosyl/mannosyltransferase